MISDYVVHDASFDDDEDGSNIVHLNYSALPMVDQQLSYWTAGLRIPLQFLFTMAMS